MNSKPFVMDMHDTLSSIVGYPWVDARYLGSYVEFRRPYMTPEEFKVAVCPRSSVCTWAHPEFDMFDALFQVSTLLGFRGYVGQSTGFTTDGLPYVSRRHCITYAAHRHHMGVNEGVRWEYYFDNRQEYDTSLVLELFAMVFEDISRSSSFHTCLSPTDETVVGGRVYEAFQDDGSHSGEVTFGLRSRPEIRGRTVFRFQQSLYHCINSLRPSAEHSSVSVDDM